MASNPSKRRRTDDDEHLVPKTTFTGALLEVGKGGDLFLKAGTGAQGCLIQVHSFCLKLASPVFKAMLEGPFIESTTSYTAKQPLLLPDDDGAAFLELCQILHHHPSYSQRLDILPQLVMLADKYQCLEAVRPHVQSALSPHFSNIAAEGIPLDSHAHLVEAMCIAYIVLDEQLFHRTSATVLVNGKWHLVHNQSKRFEGLLPPSMIGKIHIAFS